MTLQDECSATTYSEKLNHQNFYVWNSYGQHGQVTMTIPDASFLGVWFHSYTIHRLQYDQRLLSQLYFVSIQSGLASNI